MPLAECLAVHIGGLLVLAEPIKAHGEIVHALEGVFMPLAQDIFYQLECPAMQIGGLLNLAFSINPSCSQRSFLPRRCSSTLGAASAASCTPLQKACESGWRALPERGSI